MERWLESHGEGCEEAGDLAWDVSSLCERGALAWPGDGLAWSGYRLYGFADLGASAPWGETVNLTARVDIMARVAACGVGPAVEFSSCKRRLRSCCG